MAGCLRSAVPLALRSNLIETIGGLRGLIEKLRFLPPVETKRGNNNMGQERVNSYKKRRL
jgi:hypothetical protein